MTNNPLVSYCLFTYNHESYVRESLQAALAQSYSPLEIVISDDCSSDGTVETIEAVLREYDGPHRIVSNRNEENMGIGAHVSKVLLELASGDYVVTVGGDDVSFPEHIETAVERILDTPDEFVMADFSSITIDELGRENSSRRTIGSPDVISGEQVYYLEDYLRMSGLIATFAPGRIISRKLLDTFGEISGECPTEDTVLGLRALLMGGVLRTSDVLIKYRKHSGGVSGGENLRKVPLEGVFAQYYKDVDTALSRGLIDGTTERRLQKRLRAERCLRYSRMHYPTGSILYYLNRAFAEFVSFLYRNIPALIRYEKRNS